MLGVGKGGEKTIEQVSSQTQSKPINQTRELQGNLPAAKNSVRRRGWKGGSRGLGMRELVGEGEDVRCADRPVPEARAAVERDAGRFGSVVSCSLSDARS